MATVHEVIQKLMAEATYCARCEQDFDAERTKYPPSESEVWWTGKGDVICEPCAESAWERWNDSLNEM